MSRRRYRDRATSCGCGAEVHDGIQTCEECLAKLDTALGDLPWLDEQLEVSISRQRGVDNRGGTPSTGEHALPWNDRASKAHRRLQRTLANWITRIDELGVHHQAPTLGLPRGDHDRWTITAMSRWLAWRVDGLATHPAGHRAMLDITSAAASATQTVLWKRRSRIFLGPCNAILLDPRTLIPTGACPGEVYADEGEDNGRCDHCHLPYLVEERRARLERELDDTAFTAAGIARLSTFLGLDLSREQVRKRINQWHRRGRILASTHDPLTGEPMFRYGAVRALLADEISRGA